MAKQILKAELARQNTALRAELSQVKADLERALAHIQTLETERAAKPAQPSAPSSKKALTRAELMAQAQKVARAKKCTTKILDGAVYYHDGSGWQVAA